MKKKAEKKYIKKILNKKSKKRKSNFLIFLIFLKGKNPLHLASAAGHSLIVLELLNTKGIDVNFVTPGVGTALHGIKKTKQENKQERTQEGESLLLILFFSFSQK